VISVYKPTISDKAKEYVNDCLNSSWISSKGKYTKIFEDMFALKTGIRYTASCCNGTCALHLALMALGVGEGDQVIVPSFTYIASANAIKYTGADPVFVDCLEDTWQIDPKDVLRKITPKTKAIMPVHLYGHPANMDAICQIALDNNLFVVEDCAEAFGSKYKDRHVGSFGDVSAYSFFGNKTITTGEGGMVVTNNPALHDKILKLKSQGLVSGRQYWHDVIGYNYRMTNIQAAIGCAQLESSDKILEQKRALAHYYMDHFQNTEISWQKESDDVLHSYWMFNVIMDIDINQRNTMMDKLNEKGIETRPLFYPIHTMPIYYKKNEIHPVCEKINSTGFSIPSYPELNTNQLDYIADSIKEALNGV
tara:strand:+ start:2045 stop:3139 length:1095 start_codon:yes stop_codon:yes gene_type:complete